MLNVFSLESFTQSQAIYTPLMHTLPTLPHASYHCEAKFAKLRFLINSAIFVLFLCIFSFIHRYYIALWFYLISKANWLAIEVYKALNHHDLGNHCSWTAQLASESVVSLSCSAVEREFTLLVKKKKRVIRPLSVTVWRADFIAQTNLCCLHCVHECEVQGLSIHTGVLLCCKTFPLCKVHSALAFLLSDTLRTRMCSKFREHTGVTDEVSNLNNFHLK